MALGMMEERREVRCLCLGWWAGNAKTNEQKGNQARYLMLKFLSLCRRPFPWPQGGIRYWLIVQSMSPVISFRALQRVYARWCEGWGADSKLFRGEVFPGEWMGEWIVRGESGTVEEDKVVSVGSQGRKA